MAANTSTTTNKMFVQIFLNFIENSGNRPSLLLTLSLSLVQIKAYGVKSCNI